MLIKNNIGHSNDVLIKKFRKNRLNLDSFYYLTQYRKIYLKPNISVLY